MKRFIGTYPIQVGSDKARFAIPSAWRPEFKGQKIYLVDDRKSDFLFLFPDRHYEAFLDKMDKKDYNDSNRLNFMEDTIGDLEMDDNGRIYIPSWIREKKFIYPGSEIKLIGNLESVFIKTLRARNPAPLRAVE